MNSGNSISSSFASGKQLAILLDPDHYNEEKTSNIIGEAVRAGVDYFFVGGSLIHNSLNNCIQLVKSLCDIPVILFPGNAMQISDQADAILFISLVSGRNPEYLIGHHVLAAPFLKKSGLEILPTAYILIENGRKTSVEYMSNTSPIPADKHDIAVATAIASEMLGFRYIYLEAGSGASNIVGQKLIKEVRLNTSIPLIVGGGIRNAEDAKTLFHAGADLLVVGNAIEENFSLIKSISAARN